MDEETAVSYFRDVLGDLVCTIEELMTSEIAHAPFPLRRDLKRRFRNEEDLVEFFKEYDGNFMVENGKATAFDPSLENGRQNAVAYFENELNLYDTYPFYMNFRGHIGQADADVIDFIETFYHGEEFKNFLLSHPDVFVMFSDDTVALIENISVDYFEDVLDTYEEGAYVMNLRGHVGQAPSHVMNYINTYYPGDRFQEFLQNNPDVFRIVGDYVYLNEDDGN